MSNKKGQGNESLSWIIGALIGIMATSILVVVGIQWYATTQKTEESFDSLTTKIAELKDGEETSMAYYLPDGYLLVSFSNGDDFTTGVSEIPGQEYLTGEACVGTVQIPNVCGEEDCLCICDGSNRLSYENACIENPKKVKCHLLTTEATKDLKVDDSDCKRAEGVYREGPSNGVFTLFLKREGNTIHFCSTSDCPPIEETPSEEELIAQQERNEAIGDAFASA